MNFWKKTRLNYGVQKITSSKPACLSSEANHTAKKRKKGKLKYAVFAKTFSLHDRSRSSVVLAFCQFQCNEVIQLPGENPAKLCWECEFISKFAIESASYKRTNDSIFVIQVTSPDIDKLIEMQKEFGSLSELRMLDDKYFYANIDWKKTVL